MRKLNLFFFVIFDNNSSGKLIAGKLTFKHTQVEAKLMTSFIKCLVVILLGTSRIKQN